MKKIILKKTFKIRLQTTYRHVEIGLHVSYRAENLHAEIFVQVLWEL